MGAPVMLRPAAVADLAAINRVIEAAVTGWDLPARVKRLSLPLYRYTVTDMAMLELVVAEAAGRIVGVAAWEPAGTVVPDPGGGLLLHGLYVDPSRHGEGVGTRLLQAVEAAARNRGLAGVLVKAQRDAAGFFRHRGYRPLAVADTGRDYAHRWWKAVA